MKMKGKRVYSPHDYPKAEHFQIHLTEPVTEYSGWEPENGPSSPTPFTVCHVYEEESAWRADLIELFGQDYNRKDIAAFKVTPAPIAVNVEVKLGIRVGAAEGSLGTLHVR
jgi:hypothetical protein